MRNYLHIDLNNRTVESIEQDGEELVRVGRYLIAKTLVQENIAGVDPLSPDNPLIFSAGPVCRHQLLQCQPHQCRLQEPADGRYQGSQCRRHVRCGAGPTAPVWIYPARRSR